MPITESIGTKKWYGEGQSELNTKLPDLVSGGTVTLEPPTAKIPPPEDHGFLLLRNYRRLF
jgi:hypothetical protein